MELSCILDEGQNTYCGPSPRNTNASCISAITFETHDSEPNVISVNQDKEIRSSVERESEGLSKGDLFQERALDLDAKTGIKLQEATASSPDKQSLFIKGSLYSRIMNGFQERAFEGTDESASPEKFGALDFEREVDDNHVHTSTTESRKESRVNDNFSSDHEEKDTSIIEEIDVEEDIEEEEQSNDFIHDTRMTPMGLSSEILEHNTTLSSANEQHEEQSNDMTDQWREVHDDRTGKTYFYNRRTRESRWSLPSNAILLRRKRQYSERLDNSKILTSLREVSMSDITTESSFTNNDDAEEPKYVLDRCRILRESVAKRQRFFPDSFLNESVSRPLKSFFCMYCGISVQTPNALKQHLHFQCSAHDLWKEHNQIEHQQLQTILKEKWKSPWEHDSEEGDKENKAPINETKGSEENVPFHYSVHCDRTEETYLSPSDDEDTIIDDQLRRQCQISLKENYFIDGGRIQSSCAFCDKTFPSGTKLSQHLLHCKVRQKSSKKRLSHLKGSSDRKKNLFDPLSDSKLQSNPPWVPT